IAQSGADIQRLLQKLRGSHSASLESRLLSVLLALGFLSFIPSILNAPASRSAPAIGWIIVAFLLAFALALVLEAFCRYEIDENGITKKHPLAPFSWTLHRGDIHRITLEFNRSWQLAVLTSPSKKRRASL